MSIFIKSISVFMCLICTVFFCGAINALFDPSRAPEHITALTVLMLTVVGYWASIMLYQEIDK